jgi:hypothetical protein
MRSAYRGRRPPDAGPSGTRTHTRYRIESSFDSSRHWRETALDAADVRDAVVTEGLLRALLEAMAKVTGCGRRRHSRTAAARIPGTSRPAELLLNALTGLTAGAAREAAGERNASVADAYHEREQAAIRRAFCQSVHDASFAGRAVTTCA